MYHTHILAYSAYGVQSAKNLIINSASDNKYLHMYVCMYNRPHHNASTVHIEATNQFHLSHFSLLRIQSYFYSAPRERYMPHTYHCEGGVCDRIDRNAYDNIGRDRKVSIDNRYKHVCLYFI